MSKYLQQHMYLIAGGILLLLAALLLHRNHADTHVATYLPRYLTITAEDAQTLSAPFHPEDPSHPIESDDAFTFPCTGGILTINQKTNQLHFEAYTTPANHDQTQELCNRYSTQLNTTIYTEETATANTTILRIAPKLGGLPNLAFPTTITLDRATGELLTLETYPFAYDRLSTCRVKSPEAALSEWQDSQPQASKKEAINKGGIQTVTLVYHLRDSILQPAYLLEDTRADGTTVFQTIPAADFTNP